MAPAAVSVRRIDSQSLRERCGKGGDLWRLALCLVGVSRQEALYTMQHVSVVEHVHTVVSSERSPHSPLLQRGNPMLLCIELQHCSSVNNARFCAGRCTKGEAEPCEARREYSFQG